MWPKCTSRPWTLATSWARGGQKESIKAHEHLCKQLVKMRKMPEGKYLERSVLNNGQFVQSLTFYCFMFTLWAGKSEALDLNTTARVDSKYSLSQLTNSEPSKYSPRHKIHMTHIHHRWKHYILFDNWMCFSLLQKWEQPWLTFGWFLKRRYVLLNRTHLNKAFTHIKCAITFTVSFTKSKFKWTVTVH